MGSDHDGQQPKDVKVDEAQINEAFKHIFWSRLVVISEARAEDQDQIGEAVERKWALGPDIIEECNAVA